MTSDRTRAVVAGGIALLLAVATGWFLVLGVQVRSVTGGLLAQPFPQTHLVGGWLLGAAVTGTAALLVALEAVAAPRRARRSGS